MTRVVVVGAGVGGLTAAALLARAGLDVTVLEAHADPGGCASTFSRGGYRFDAGATLPVGFYPGGPMDILARALDIHWPARYDPRVMTVHLPDGAAVTLRSDDARWEERRAAFGRKGERFWRWQEHTADDLWDLALRLPSWPPQSPREAGTFAGDAAGWILRDLRRLNPGLALDALRPVAAHLPGADERLRLFVDAQLLISAQTTSAHAVALYGAAALDLPRRGPAHLPGGMGAVAQGLADAVARFGGRVLYHQEATRVVLQGGRPAGVDRRDGERFAADAVLLNTTHGDAAALLGETPNPAHPPDGWGAFMVYVGVDANVVPDDAILHHQVVAGEPLSEGNAPFISISPAWDDTRAPAGRRAVTISAHTRPAPWWELRRTDRAAYEARKAEYTARILAVAERAIPGLRDAAEMVLAGTPVTFHRYTRRAVGWVGGFPQTSLGRFRGPRLRPRVWLVGDSIFPGQSVAAVALGGIRVARAVLAERGVAHL